MEVAVEQQGLHAVLARKGIPHLWHQHAKLAWKSYVFGGCARAVLARKGIPDLWRQHAQLAWKSYVFGGCARAVLARKGIPDLWRQHAQLAWKSCVFFVAAVAGFGYASRGACISKPATCHPQHLPLHLSGDVFLYDLVQRIYDG